MKLQSVLAELRDMLRRTNANSSCEHFSVAKNGFLVNTYIKPVLFVRAGMEVVFVEPSISSQPKVSEREFKAETSLPQYAKKGI